MYLLQPRDHDVSISKQTSSDPATCSTGLSDVLIMSCDSQDSETVQKETVMNSEKKDSLTLNGPVPWKSQRTVFVQAVEQLSFQGVHLCTIHLGTVLARKYSTAITTEKQALRIMVCPWNRWGFLFTPPLFPNIAMVTNHHLSFIYTPLLHAHCMR